MIDIEALQPGDLIRNTESGHMYQVLTARLGNAVVAVRSVTVSAAGEWDYVPGNRVQDAGYDRLLPYDPNNDLDVFLDRHCYRSALADISFSALLTEYMRYLRIDITGDRQKPASRLLEHISSKPDLFIYAQSNRVCGLAIREKPLTD